MKVRKNLAVWLCHRLWLIAVVALYCCASAAWGETLTFDQIREGGVVVPTISGREVPQDYGDRVSGSPQDVPGGQFTYGVGPEGFAPNVVVDYSTTSFASGGVSLWQDQYGDLTNVLFGNQNSQALLIRLTADFGFNVLLYSFDLGGWPNADYVINAVRVLDGSTELFSQSNVLVEGDFNGPRRTSFAFSLPLAGNQLLIEIDYSNLPGNQQDNIGIDNIRFGQSPPPATSVPETPTAYLLSMSLIALGCVRLRRRV